MAGNVHFNVFLDETGDHALNYIDANFPLFLLCGMIVSDADLKLLELEINRMKQICFKSTDVVLHSREIRKCEGSFQVLFDLPVKQAFYESLNRILSDVNYHLICSAVHKEKHIKKYGKCAGNPYTLSLSFVVERLVFLLDAINKQATVSIFVEQRGRKEDQQLLAHFNTIRDSGTYYIDHRRLQDMITSFTFHNKRENIVGLQVADLCAYPIARHVLNPKEPFVPYQIIEDKIYRNPRTGSQLGWGIKVFP